MAGDRDWGALARYRCRLLLGPIPSGSDRVEELKRRLRLWEDGRFQELLDRLRGQQSEAARMSRSGGAGVDAEERLGGSTRKKAREGAVSKAFKGLVGGVQNGTESERRSWTKELIPRAETGHATLTTDTERQESAACSWVCGNDEEAKRAMGQAGRSAGSLRSCHGFACPLFQHRGQVERDQSTWRIFRTAPTQVQSGSCCGHLIN